MAGNNGGPHPPAEELSTLGDLIRELLVWVKAFVTIQIADMWWVREGTAVRVNVEPGTAHRVYVLLDPVGDEPAQEVAARWPPLFWDLRRMLYHRCIVLIRRGDGAAFIDTFLTDEMITRPRG